MLLVFERDVGIFGRDLVEVLEAVLVSGIFDVCGDGVWE